MTADKGNKVVIMNKGEYNGKMATILSDSETYELLKSNPLKDHNKYVRKVIRDTA